MDADSERLRNATSDERALFTLNFGGLRWVSVIPSAKRQKEIAEEIHKIGKELLDWK